MKLSVILMTIFGVATTLLGQEKITTQAQLENTLDTWHQAAANADYETYFNLMTDTAVFIGTDATEVWDVTAFKAYSKPHFDKGRAWAFKAIDRNIYIDTTNASLAWFDEHLETQMGICRGSGILKKIEGSWKIQHYVLSIAVPNKNVSQLTELKREWDNNLIEKMLKKQ